MEMEMEVDALVERLMGAAAMLEEAAARVGAVELAAAGSRVTELEERLREAEGTIASLRASARKGVGLQAKEASGEGAGGLDVALASLPVEQRIAVKAQLMRSGLL